MWIEPKTDWRASDYFNVADYNRIKTNINHLREMAVQLWPDFSVSDMGADKTYNDYSFYADEINKFENNLELICRNTFLFDVGEKKLFSDNTPFIDYKELNRLERACVTIYKNFRGRANGISRMSFRLKGGGYPWL